MCASIGKGSEQPIVRVYRPGAVLVDEGQLLKGVEVGVELGRVAALEPVGTLQGDLVEVPDELWTASLWMMHAHLESFDAPAQEWRGLDFAAWIQALLSWREESSRLSLEESVQSSITELEHHGLGFVLASCGEERVASSSTLHGRGEFWPELFQPEWGRSPDVSSRCALHSPYGVHIKVARAVFESCDFVSIHLGETLEEREFLAKGTGPLAELFTSRGRPIPEQRWESPVEWLKDAGGLRPGVFAVHGGALSASELAQLETHGVEVVFCPGTHGYFERPTPHLEAGLKLPPLLGCDSRASNLALDPLSELRLAARMCSRFSPQSWWAAGTRRAAESIGLPGTASLEVGYARPVLRFHECPSSALGSAESVCAWLVLKNEQQPTILNLE